MTLTELRELAERATPGPWTLGGGGRDVCVRLGPHSGVPRRLWPERPDDARYIAACSPEVIKALVAVAEIAERVDDARSPAVGLLNDLSAALDALKAALA